MIGAGSTSTNETTAAPEREYRRVKRLIVHHGKEIENIRNKGSSAVITGVELAVTIFKGMYLVLEKHYEAFTNLWEQAQEHSEAHKISPPFPTTEDTALYAKVQNFYYEALGFHVQVNVPTSSDRGSLNNSSSQSSASRTLLPKININPFSGDFSTWPTFKQLFTALIKEDPVLSDIERFHYLLSYLEGPALDVIKPISITAANFQQAWEALLAVYDDKRKLASTYLEKLLAFRPLGGKPSAESLQLYLSNVTEPVVSLQNLGIGNLTNYLLCELALRCLDSVTRQAFEVSMIGTMFPPFSELRTFVQNRCSILRLTEESPSSKLEATSSRLRVMKPPSRFVPVVQSSQAFLTHAETQVDYHPHVPLNQSGKTSFSCYICKESHIIKECPTFKSASPAQRLDFLRNWQGCRNCLHPSSHRTKECTSRQSCKFCGERHHTDLHLGPLPDSNSVSVPTTMTAPLNSQLSVLSHTAPNSTSFAGTSTSAQGGVLLGTVRAFILDSTGHGHLFRGILDPGSQYSFLTDKCARQLGKTSRPFNGLITGVNSSPLTNISGKIHISFKPKSSPLLHTEAIVVPSITPPLPQVSVTSSMWQDYQAYDLSDPEFYKSLPISFLIGADLYPEVVIGSPITVHESGPRLINTVFGFTAIGRYSCDLGDHPSVSLLALATDIGVDPFPLEKFLQIEEPKPIVVSSPDDQKCEAHFVAAHQRLEGGRYCLDLPFKSDPSKIIPNVQVASNRFYALEAKLAKNPQLKKDYHTFTERSTLSTIARLFDPLGYLAPVVFPAKCIFQETWREGIEWDEPVPETIKSNWTQSIPDFCNLSKFSIPCAFVKSDTVYRLVCSSDASERGYCSVVYLLPTHSAGASMSLLKAKTRLAPMKRQSIPRLELLGALLLSQLIESLEPFIKDLPVMSVHCFTDSTIVLTWLKTPACRRKSLVANRVSQILEVTTSGQWYHIRGVENPADIGSRGVLPSGLIERNLWWNGPAWCTLPIDQWPTSQPVLEDEEVPELGVTEHNVLAPVPGENTLTSCMNRHSSFLRLVRVIAYVIRFIKILRIPKRARYRRKTNALTTAETKTARNTCIQLIQCKHFPEIIRVGGRLNDAPRSIDHRHPIPLPARSHLTTLIIDHLHRQNNHAGPSALLAFLRQQYWVPRARNLVRLRKLKCVVCVRHSKAVAEPLTSNLPAARVTGARAFQSCGVDFAGPSLYRDSSRRSPKVHKAYLRLFTCLASHAVHLELCTSLSLEAFLDAFDRFIARHGLPSRMFSNCGTNFVAASRYLKELMEWLRDETSQTAMVNHTSHLSVEWIFNPPASPYFGGSWESAIKSAKALLYKTLGNHSFTEHDLHTMFAKIEGILNSRPLLPLSTSIEDAETLTPGHLLIGQPLNSLPEPDFYVPYVHYVPVNRLNHWQFLRDRVQHFWCCWRYEYLSSLHVRTRWTTRSPNIRIGDIVIVKGAQSPPAQWPLARIIDIHPGSDNVVRVATIKTSRGTFKRAVVNLVPSLVIDVCETSDCTPV